MTIALLITAGWVLLMIAGVVFVMGANHHVETPRPVIDKEQIIWMTAAAKVAARRHA